MSIAVAKDLKPGQHLFALAESSAGSLPVPLVVTPLPISLESNDVPAAGDPGKTVKLPAALCGRLGEARRSSMATGSRLARIQFTRSRRRHAARARNATLCCGCSTPRAACSRKWTTLREWARMRESNGKPRQTAPMRCRSPISTLVEARRFLRARWLRRPVRISPSLATRT